MKCEGNCFAAENIEPFADPFSEFERFSCCLLEGSLCLLLCFSIMAVSLNQKEVRSYQKSTFNLHTLIVAGRHFVWPTGLVCSFGMESSLLSELGCDEEQLLMLDPAAAHENSVF